MQELEAEEFDKNLNNISLSSSSATSVGAESLPKVPTKIIENETSSHDKLLEQLNS